MGFLVDAIVSVRACVPVRDSLRDCDALDEIKSSFCLLWGLQLNPFGVSGFRRPHPGFAATNGDRQHHGFCRLA